MRIINKLLKISAIALLASPFTGCKEEELVKPSALMAESSVTFEAKSAEAQSFRIASDSEWMVDVDEPWITVDPMSGSNTMDVNVAVEDNYTNGVMNAPRQGVITIANKRGYSITTVVYQKGDNYLGVSEVPISDVLELEDGKFAKINGAQVVALTDEGYVVSDASGLLYVKRGADAADVAKLGDKLFLAGEKVSLYGNAALLAGEITVQSNEEVTRPAPLPLLSNLDAEKAKKIMYVSVEAGLLGRDLKFEQTLPVSVTLLDPKSGDVDLDKVNMHNVAINAYFIGLDGDNVKLAATSVDDKGENESLMAFFYDDFSWMKAYIPAEVKVGDSIKENNASAEAPNVRSNGSLSNLLDAFLAKGYEDLNPSSKTLYAQAYYWKMGKTSKATANNNNGLRLPPMELKGSELINVYIEFDWAAHMTTSGDIDKVQIVAELEGKGSFDNGTNVSDPFVTTQEKGHIEWQHAKVLAKGVNNQTRIVLRPAEYSSVTPDQQRWHVDNIKVSDSHIPYAEPEYANVTVSDEVVTFEGTPTGPASITINSDKDWTITKGQNSDWFSIDVTQGAAGSDTKVAVTCEPSTISILRRSTFVIASADTRKTIHVVQSAVGQELDPFISIKGGNSVDISGQGGEFAVTIQANTDYETKIDADWIQLAPSTVAMVEWTTLKFTAKANLGDARTGIVRFVKGNIETVLTVKQDKFEPSIKVTTTDNAVPSEGKSVPVHIVSNVDFTASTAGMTLPVSSAKAGTYDLNIPVPANTGAPRKLSVTFENAQYNYKTTFEIYQAGGSVVFSDDFSWVAPMVSAWNDANSGKKVGDTVGSSGKDAEAPNVYSNATIKSSFASAFKAQGYEDLQPSEQVIYLQDQYLKLGKTDKHNNAIRLPAATALTSPSDVFVEFDHATMCQSDGTCDDAKVVVVIEGDGEFENGTKCSDILPVIQEKGTYRWTHSGTLVKGMTSETRLVVVMYRVVMSKDSNGVYKFNNKYNYKVSGAGRIFLDNIKITK
ncbi:putative uncharacterized protein [Bacteroides sp. CAG:770]|nr:putative uncharacterized protein [Bacteroides sp. CAG:770]